MKRLLIVGMLLAAALTLPTQANFIQCPGNFCGGTPQTDLINGSNGIDAIEAGDGNDAIFAGDGRDSVGGLAGNDLIFGGKDSDTLLGGLGDDVILPGPDDAQAIQSSLGNENNDTFIIFAGETVNCQNINGVWGDDTLILIGFGPYVAEYPYGQPGAIANGSNLVIQDPVTGGYIFVLVEEGTNNLERINGLPSPNVAVQDIATFNTFRDQNCVI